VGQAIFSEVAAAFPQAQVVASDAFDDFVADVLGMAHTLPVVTGEIGDTWIYGAPTCFFHGNLWYTFTCAKEYSTGLWMRCSG
jgi:hypothetical protein